MEIENKPNRLILVMIGIFILALVMRLSRVGLFALSNFEADIALQALAVSRGTETLFGPHVAYTGLTGMSFFVFSAGQFLARFWPALFGAMVVFIPFIFYKWIGYKPATIASFFLAISPEMVGLSRIVGSPVMAFVFLLLAAGLLFEGKPLLAGLLFALGLMSGPGFWVGIFILGGSLLLSEWLFKISDLFPMAEETKTKRFWSQFGISFGITLLVVSTGFFMAPKGLSGIFAGLVSFFAGFGRSYTQPWALLPLTLIAYSSGAFVLGIWGGVRGILAKDKLELFLFVWWGVSFLFALVYPGGGPQIFIWVTLPLWILTARVLSHFIKIPEASAYVVLITTLLIIVVLAFMSLAARSFVRPGLDDNQRLNSAIAILGGLVLIVAIVLFVTYGWSDKVSLPGLLIGLAVFIMAGCISFSVRGSGLNAERSYELWYPDQTYLSSEWLTVTLDRTMSWNAETSDPVDIAVSDFETPGMKWALRDYAPVQFVPYLAPQSQPGILITDGMALPAISSSYRGQNLVWSTKVDWDAMTVFDILVWFITRDAPTQTGEVIIWVRTDLMPDNQFAPQN